jgi:hypothetical protein
MDMPACLTVFFGLLGRGWKAVSSRRMQIIALLMVVALLVPHPANAQFGFLTGLIGIISNGLSSVSGVLSAVNTTLQNVIGPLLRTINSAMTAIQNITQGILDFQQNTVYPLAAINSARALVGQIQGIYNSIRGIWNTVVRSATLANPQGLGECDSVEGRWPDRRRGRPFFSRLHAATGRDRSTSFYEGCD